MYYLIFPNIRNDYALFQIGNLCANGLGVKQNYSKAMEYYLKSADQGNYYWKDKQHDKIKL